MPREVSFTEPITTTLFSPLQLRPRALLTLLSSSFARWMATYVAPFRQLIAEHHTAVVVQSLAVDYETPDLKFEDADWLTVRTHMSITESGEWLYLSTNYLAEQRTVAHGRLVMRVLELAGDESLAARPGALPPHLRGLFESDEVVPTDVRRTFRVSRPSTIGDEIVPPQKWHTTLFRSHCEVADQWSFVEMPELTTCARERLFSADLSSSQIRRNSLLGAPFRNLRAVFRKPMFVLDECCVTTSAARLAPPHDDLIFTHNVTQAASSRPHLTVWETLAAPSGPVPYADGL